jgi:hypothetical protein
MYTYIYIVPQKSGGPFVLHSECRGFSRPSMHRSDLRSPLFLQEATPNGCSITIHGKAFVSYVFMLSIRSIERGV